MKHSGMILVCGVVAVCLTSIRTAPAQQADVGDTKVQSAPTRQGSEFQPAGRPFSDELMKQLRLKDGFAINVFAKDMGNARMMAVGGDGTVYVTRRGEGDVVALNDRDGDGVAEQRRTIAQRPGMHGIHLHDGKMYLATTGEVFVADLKPDGTIGELKALIEDLPTHGGHHNRTLAIGPTDGMLYLTVGSTCNACVEQDHRNATMLRGNADGSEMKIFAKGLRNTIGFGWHPQSKELWGMDHGIDWLGDDIPPEELNRLEDGHDYGWPYVWGDRQVNPNIDSPPDMTKEEYAKLTTPVKKFPAHNAPIGMVFYTGEQFPEEYRNDAFRRVPRIVESQARGRVRGRAHRL